VGASNGLKSPTPNPSPEGEGLEETRRVAAWAFDQILVMLHPLMPFITEELWHAMGERPYELIVARWPEPQTQVDPHAKAEIELLIKAVADIRAERTALEISPGAILPATLATSSSGYLDFVNRHQPSLTRLARLKPANVTPGIGTSLIGPEVETFVVSDVLALVGHHTIRLMSGDLSFVSAVQGYDADAQRARISKIAVTTEKERDSLAQRLANPNFTERAKPEAVEKARADHEAKAAEADRLRAALERLG
jgi:valyl-tRNA synthetase